MSSKDSGQVRVIRRSCEKECIEPTEGKITGTIPDWLEGTLIRNGPGLFQVGPDVYEHWFDGLAVLHRFQVGRGGKVTYQNRFLNSTTYQRNMNAQRIVVSEFGTVGHPDPCMTIFQRFKSFFSMGEATDNDSVNVVKIGDGLYASTETPIINRIDPETLETKEKVDLSSLLAVNTSTAHPHYAKDGAVINMGSAFSSKPAYCIIQFPAKGEDSLKEGSVLCRIPCTYPMNPSYYHSFGLTENYLIFVEQPLSISFSSILWGKIWRQSYEKSLKWNPQQKVKFHVVRRSTGEILDTKLLAEPFMVFHHANAYESNDGKELVVDMCTYEDDKVVRSLYLRELGLSLENAKDGTTGVLKGMMDRLESRTLRFILPLEEVTKEQVESGDNVVTLKGSRATAVPQKDGTILCTPENLTEDLNGFEMPQINYEAFNGKKYKYIYGIGALKEGKSHGLIKVDTDERSFQCWNSLEMIPSEPVFVARPGATKEDDGVLLSSLLTDDDPKSVSLLILDAATMKELARADFKSPGVIPSDLHGMFFGPSQIREQKTEE